MFRVVINRNDGRAWQADFETQEDAQEWLDKQLLKPGRSSSEVTYEIKDISKEPEVIQNKRLKELPSIREFMLAVLDDNPSALNDLKVKWKKTKEKFPM